MTRHLPVEESLANLFHQAMSNEDDEIEGPPKTSLNFRKVKFVGRKDELMALQNTYSDFSVRTSASNMYDSLGVVTKNQALPPVTLIHGESGIGKSALAFKFLEDLNEQVASGSESMPSGVYYMSGEFFEGDHSRPFSAIIDSASKYISMVMEERPTEFKKILICIKERLGTDEINILLAFLPELSSLILSYSKSQRARFNDFSQPNTSSKTTDDSKSQSSEVNESSHPNPNTSPKNTSVTFQQSESESEGYDDEDYDEDDDEDDDDEDDDEDNNYENVVLEESFKIVKEYQSMRESLGDDEDPLSWLPQSNVWLRLKYVLYNFFKIIIELSDRPLIMVLDNLHWADNESLDLVITALLRDKTLHNLIFLGAYLDTEENETDVFTKKWMSYSSHTRKLETLQIIGISENEANMYISELMGLETSDTESISSLAHNRSKGNILYMILILLDLQKRKFITYDENLSQWVWKKCDWDKFPSNEEVLVAKILSYCPKFQTMIKIASYTTHALSKCSFLFIMQHLEIPVADETFSRYLAAAVNDRLFVYDEKSDKYHTYNDQVSRIGRSLLVSIKGNREIQEEIGKCLYTRSQSNEGEDWMLAGAVRNLNASNSTHLGVARMVELNLNVGSHFLTNAAFEAALAFLESGLQFLRRIDFHWHTEYKLSLRLFRALTNTYFYLDEAEYREKLEKSANEVLDNAVRTEDKGETYLCLALYWSRKDYQRQSMDLMLKVLRNAKLLPKRSTKIQAWKCYKKVQTWFQTHCDDDVLNVPIVSRDDPKMYTMKCFHQALVSSSFLGKDIEAIICATHALKSCSILGLCAEVSSFLVFFANTMLVIDDNLKLALRYGDLALKVIQVAPEKDVAAGVYFGLAAYVYAWNWDTEKLLLLSQKGYRFGMESGSIELAFLARFALNRIIFANGYPLEWVAEALDETLNQLSVFQVQSTLIQTDEIRRNVYIFMGKVELQWEDLRSFGPEEGIDVDDHRLFIGYSNRLQLGVYFGKYEFAEEMAKKLDKSTDDFASRMKVRELEHWLCTLLMLTGRAHQTGKKKYKKKAKKYAKATRKRLTHRGYLRDGYFHLLIDAEMLALKRISSQRLKHLYKDAAISALNDGFTPHASLILELGGDKLLQTGANNLSFAFFTAAKSCYEEWGAMAKVTHLNVKLAKFLSVEHTTNVIPSIEIFFEKNQKVRKPEFISFDLSKVPDFEDDLARHNRYL